MSSLSKGKILPERIHRRGRVTAFSMVISVWASQKGRIGIGISEGRLSVLKKKCMRKLRVDPLPGNEGDKFI